MTDCRHSISYTQHLPCGFRSPIDFYFHFFKTQLYCYTNRRNQFWTFGTGAHFMRSRRRMGPTHYDYLHEKTSNATSKILWYIHLSTGLKTRIQNSKDPRPSVHDQKYLKTFEMWCGGEMEGISWTDRVTNKVQYYTESRGGQDRPTVQRRKTNFLCGNCLMKHVIQGKIERRRGTKTRNKTSAATGWSTREQKTTELEGRNARSLSIEISIWKRPLTCQKPGYVMTKWMNGLLYTWHLVAESVLRG